MEMSLSLIVTSLLLALVSIVQGLCPVPCINSSDIEIRLVSVPGLHSEDGNVGRVEVCCNGRWGTIGLENKIDFWSEKNIQVACMQLGFTGGLNSILPINFSAAVQRLPSREVLLHKVACNGAESEIAECAKGAPILSSNSADVYIVCRPRNHDYSSVHRAGAQSGDLRLFGSARNGKGAVQIFTGNEWATVCPDSSWVNSDARILCNALGFDMGITSLFPHNESTGVMATLSNAQCSDVINAPATFASDQVFTKYCSFTSGPCQTRDQLAGIQCSSLGTSATLSFRLFGIDLFDDSVVSGVFEVFEEQRWGMVCTNSSRQDGNHLARIICSNLLRQNFPNAELISIPTEKLFKYESSMKPIWLDGITCPEDALTITDCDFEDPLGYSDCSNREILAVRCEVHSQSGGNPLIIAGAIVLVLVAVIAILIFLVYLRRVLTRRDRVSVTSVALADPGGDIENRNERQNNGAMNFVLVQESQLNDIKHEGASNEELQDYGSIHPNHHSNV